MLPFLTTPDSVPTLAEGQNVVAVPPSNRFNPLSGGSITDVNVKPQTYQRTRGNTSARDAGLRYEDKVQRHLCEKLPGYLSGPHVHFRDAGKWRTVIPDGVLVRSGGLFIFEIKFQHMAEAWWQLSRLYMPVLQSHYNKVTSLLEVCRTYDPTTPFPCAHTVVSDLDTWLQKPQPEFGVYILRL